MVSVASGGASPPAQGGDRLVSRVVGSAITALFKHSEQVDTQIRAEPVSKLLQGSIDGFDFIGRGLEMYNGLRLEGLELFAQAVSIDFSRIFQGQVNLRQPTQATMRVVLTESDLTSSFNTPFILDKLKRLEWQGQPLLFRQVSVQLENAGILRLQAQVSVNDQWLDLTLTSTVQTEGQKRIQLVKPSFAGDPQALPIGESILNHINQLLDLDKFALDGMRLRVDRIRVQSQKLVFYGTAAIDHFPKGRKS